MNIARWAKQRATMLQRRLKLERYKVACVYDCTFGSEFGLKCISCCGCGAGLEHCFLFVSLFEVPFFEGRNVDALIILHQFLTYIDIWHMGCN